MKKLILMLSISVFLVEAASAQTALENYKKDRFTYLEHQGVKIRKSPEDRATKQTTLLTQKLALSEKQQKKVQALNLKHAEQMKNFRTRYAENGNSQPQRGDRDDFRNSSNSWEKEFKGILTKDQVTKYETSRQEMKYRQPARHTHPKSKVKK